MYLPLIKATKGVEAFCNMAPCVTADVCEERCEVAALGEYLHGCSACAANVRRPALYYDKRLLTFNTKGRRGLGDNAKDNFVSNIKGTL